MTRRRTTGNAARKKTTRRKCTVSTRIAKSLTWTEKYLLRVKRRMPTIPMPRVIRSFKPRLDRKHRTLGSCTRSDRSINLATHYVKEVEIKGKKKRILSPLTRLEILQTLAHELSHLVYDDHAYEQEWYGRTIFNAFGLSEACPHCGGRGRIPARYRNDYIEL